MTSPVSTLTLAISALPADQRARLLRHAEAGTPICCGKQWCDFVSGDAG